MSERIAVVVTSISKPNAVLAGVARGCMQAQWDFCLIGDKKSPDNFELEGCRFYDMKAQIATGLTMAAACPVNHYARKNIGYLIAIRDEASIIIETDDDNIPLEQFWFPRARMCDVRIIDEAKWVNVYRYFTEALVWPRGLPLNAIHDRLPDFETLPRRWADCPIQQGLADDNPDVDALYRLIFPHRLTFRGDRRLALGQATWCPFNSQNTAWWREAFPLMYLPAYCSFRMTDIWRSFVAERICWENEWSVMFHEPTVRQERNIHDLMRDFADEVPGYLNNHKIGDLLAGVGLGSGLKSIPDNMRICYRTLADAGIVGAREPELLEAWLRDLSTLGVL